jgi:hypothetical protein
MAGLLKWFEDVRTDLKFRGTGRARHTALVGATADPHAHARTGAGEGHRLNEPAPAATAGPAPPTSAAPPRAPPSVPNTQAGQARQTPGSGPS